MQFSSSVLVLAAGLAAVSSCTSSRNARPTSAAVASTAVREVEAVYRAGIDAFNRQSLEVFVAQFADDIRMYTPTGWVAGKAAVTERFRSTFAQFPKSRMAIDSLQVQAVGAETVTVAFRWRVYPMGTGPAFHGVGSGVYVRRLGQWVEALEHETVTHVDAALQQAPPPPSRR
jgi:uncharacterized protein (TIGR02246 family)